MIVRTSLSRAPAANAFAVGLLLLLAGGAAQAQSIRLYELGGGFRAGSKVEASAVQVENFFYDNTDGISATGYRVRPEVNLSRNGATVNARFSTYAERADYDLPGSLDNYTDYGVSGLFSWRPFTKHLFDLDTGYQRGHDQAGLQRTEGQPRFDVGEIDEWDQTRVLGSYEYGSPNSLARNRVSAGHRSREYSNNRQSTRFLNYDIQELGYELGYDYSPKTSLVFDVGHRQINYERGTLLSVGNRDGNELTIRGGLRWLATAKTSGDVRVGVRSYSLDGRQRRATDSLSWKAQVQWAPATNTQITLATGESTTETFRADTFFIEDRTASLNWRQVWSERLSTTLGGSYLDSKFVGSSRKDESYGLNAGLDYLLLRELSLIGEYNSNERNSNESQRDFEVSTARLGLRWTP